MDLEKLAQELDFDIEDIEMLLEVFIEGAKENLETLKGALEENDYVLMSETAHAIKGSAANLLLDDIVKPALQIELSAAKQEKIDYKTNLDEIERHLNKLED